MIRRQVGVAHRHADVGMAQDFLQAQDVAAIHHEMAGERMPQNMGSLSARECQLATLGRASEPALQFKGVGRIQCIDAGRAT